MNPTEFKLTDLVQKITNELALGRHQLEKSNLQYEVKTEGNQHWFVITSEKYSEKQNAIQDLAILFKKVLSDSWYFHQLQSQIACFPPKHHLLTKRWRKPALQYITATLERFTDFNSGSSAVPEYINMLRMLKFTIECDLRNEKSWRKQCKDIAEKNKKNLKPKQKHRLKYFDHERYRCRTCHWVFADHWVQCPRCDSFNSLKSKQYSRVRWWFVYHFQALFYDPMKPYQREA